MLASALDLHLTHRVQQWDQYEVWAQAGGKWELLAWFRDFDTANAVAQSRHTGVRLVHAVFEDGRAVTRDTIAEIHAGAKRES